MNSFNFCITILAVLAPLFASAQVEITEVAWMGTANSQYEEWIELRNGGSDSVDLSGWLISKSGGTKLIELSGTVTPDDYFLICRTTASLQSPLGGACDHAGAFGGSGINNSSDVLTLKDSAGATVDSVDGSGGWPAGEAASKKTMQKSGSSWITAPATPGAPTSEQPDEEPGSDKDPEDEETEPEPEQGSSGGSGKSTKDSKVKTESIAPDPVYAATVSIPDYGITGVPIDMKAAVKKDKVLMTIRGRYRWSMGDGANFEFLKNQPVRHAFEYPGTYTVVLAYYSSVLKDEPDAIFRKRIVIADDAVSIGTTGDGGVVLSNNSTHDIDLFGWNINSKGFEFSFPKYTILSKGEELSVSGKTLSIPISDESLVLKNQDGKLIAAAEDARHAAALPGAQDSGLFEQADATEQPLEASGSSSAASTGIIGGMENSTLWTIAFAVVAGTGLVAYLAVRLYALYRNDEDADEGFAESDIL